METSPDEDSVAVPEPAPLSGCSSLELRKLSRRVSQQFDRVVAPAGLKTTQYSLLAHIVQAGAIRPGELADRLEMDASTLTRNLRPLLAQGWVQTSPGADGRSRVVRATASGLEVRARAQREWRKAQRAFIEQLGADRVRRLHAIIDECLQAMGPAHRHP
ncbi:MAG: MarR family winged helix-turn-helix transcriptional regulator [Pseudomonadota bacterium]|nr:MarR family winged helix-turn-helix transcriptional regulator [Pseudomonadota bacterium]